MNIQRLKFAWARGARIEWRDPYADRYSKLWSIRLLPAWDENQSYRIHPEDEHLQYGPLSSTLRNSVIYDAPIDSLEYRAAQMIFNALYDFPPGPTRQFDWGMQKLAFSEYLADLGL